MVEGTLMKRFLLVLLILVGVAFSGLFGAAGGALAVYSWSTRTCRRLSSPAVSGSGVH